MTDTRLLTGFGVSPGIAVGPVYVVRMDLPATTHRVIAKREVDSELARLHEALADVRRQLDSLRERTGRHAGPEEAKIFGAQILMLEDQEFLGEVESLIRENQLTAERAFEFKVLEVREQWAQSSSATLRQRITDLTGIQIRVIQSLLGESLEDVLHGSGARPAVVLARELTPGLTIQFEQSLVTGLASEQGTRTAHAAILARSLGIPCVMGLDGAIDRIEPGASVILDGSRGTVLVDPTKQEIEEAYQREGRRLALEGELEEVVGQPSATTDGTVITLRGNIDLPEEVGAAAEHGAEGVGLLRTEFLILGRTELPTEDEQVVFFERVGRRFAGHPVVIRSYDLGGDKFPAPFRAGPERNPFLGWRAIRVCLDEPEMFRTQIRALLRARASADLQLMLPLVTQVEELDRTREIVAELVDDLERSGVAAGTDLPVGVMIETPAAAMLVDELAEDSDFLSVGTNDLTQYTLAMDRGSARLADRFSPLHPAVVRLLKHIIDGGERAGLTVSVCGEMASDPISALLLLGLGYRVLSASPTALPLIRWLVRQIDLATAERAAAAALEARTTGAVTEILERHMAEHVDLSLLAVGRLPVSRRGATLRTPATRSDR